MRAEKFVKIVTRLLPLLCLIAFAALSIGSSLYESATYDEPIHIAAGYVYLHTGSYRMEPSHPPLVRLWSALPLLFQNLNYPEFPQMENFKTHRKFSDAFLNHNLVPTDIILTAARAMIVLCGDRAGRAGGDLVSGAVPGRSPRWSR